MSRGQRTPDHIKAQFRAHYLATGLAKASARAVGLPVSTGIDLAQEADADPEFGRLRSTMLPTACGLLLSRVLRASEIVGEALEAGPFLDAMGTPVDRIAEKVSAQATVYKALEGAHSRHLEREAQAKTATQGRERPERLVIVRYSDTKQAQQAESSGPADSAE